MILPRRHAGILLAVVLLLAGCSASLAFLSPSHDYDDYGDHALPSDPSERAEFLLQDLKLASLQNSTGHHVCIGFVVGPGVVVTASDCLNENLWQVVSDPYGQDWLGPRMCRQERISQYHSAWAKEPRSFALLKTSQDEGEEFLCSVTRLPFDRQSLPESAGFFAQDEYLWMALLHEPHETGEHPDRAVHQYTWGLSFDVCKADLGSPVISAPRGAASSASGATVIGVVAGSADGCDEDEDERGWRSRGGLWVGEGLELLNGHRVKNFMKTGNPHFGEARTVSARLFGGGGGGPGFWTRSWHSRGM